MQAGGGADTVVSWVVDEDNTVVKYCDDNIVTIFVPGEGGAGLVAGAEAGPSLAIIGTNTLRLRIAPGSDSDCEMNYMEIVESEGGVGDYSYCSEAECRPPPPLPPRTIRPTCSTFPRPAVMW